MRFAEVSGNLHRGSMSPLFNPTEERVSKSQLLSGTALHCLIENHLNWLVARIKAFAKISTSDSLNGFHHAESIGNEAHQYGPTQPADSSGQHFPLFHRHQPRFDVKSALYHVPL